MMADMVFIEESLSEINLEPSEKDLDNLVEELNEIYETNENEFDEIFILNLQGEVIASTNSEYIGKEELRDVEFLVAKTGAYINKIHYSEIVERLVIDISSVIISDTTKNVSGVMVAVMALERLGEITTARSELSGIGETYIIDNEGYMITPSIFLKGEKGENLFGISLQCVNCGLSVAKTFKYSLTGSREFQ